MPVCQILLTLSRLSLTFLSLFLSMSKSKSSGLFNVEAISKERLFRGRAQYLVSWEGHDDVTWQYAHTIEHTPAFNAYMRAKKKRILSISESRVFKDELQFKVAYTGSDDDIWEPAAFVKGTKALKSFLKSAPSLSTASSSSLTPASSSSTGAVKQRKRRMRHTGIEPLTSS